MGFFSSSLELSSRGVASCSGDTSIYYYGGGGGRADWNRCCDDSVRGAEDVKSFVLQIENKIG